MGDADSVDVSLVTGVNEGNAVAVSVVLMYLRASRYLLTLHVVGLLVLV